MSSDTSKTAEFDLENSKPTREKVCKVCGDKALGYNFNAITCESCKAFFRRNALKNKEFKCPFNKNCEINPVTRRFCQLCRLIKCFEIGMRKEYIMSEDDKKEKRKKIEENRATKKKVTDDASDTLCGSKIKLARRLDKDDQENGEDAKYKKMRNLKPVRISLLNMASTSKRTYHKKQIKYDSNAEQLIQFPSPALPEPAPETVSVVESRTCNAFNENNQCDGSTSRSVEIYQISKSKEEYKTESPSANLNFTDSNLIKIILDSEFSKPSEVLTNTSFSREKEGDKSCSFKKTFKSHNEYVISEASLLELTKNNKNIFLESTKDGKKILLINHDTSETGECKKRVLSTLELEEAAEKMKTTNDVEKVASTPLLSNLINSRRSSDIIQTSTTSKNLTEDIFQDIPRTSICVNNSIDSILSEAIKLEYETYTSMNPGLNGRELNDAERAKLNELIVANKALLAPLEDDLSGDNFGFNAFSGCGPSMLVDVLNLTAVAIRRLIKMSKKVNAFKNMCQDDQIALLKGGCTEMMILRSAMTYDPDRDSWKIPQSKEKLMNIKVDILKEAGGKVFEEHQRFLQTFDPKWRNDENIMLILSAIALFTPDRPKVVHYDVIKLEQNSYYYLLRRYLESVYQGCEARLIFLKLIHKISELHRLNEEHVRVYLDVNPREIEPLLIEIFDLKSH